MTCEECKKYDTCQSHPPGHAYGIVDALGCFEWVGEEEINDG